MVKIIVEIADKVIKKWNMPVSFRVMVLKENLPRCKISEGVTKVVHTSLEVFFGLTSWAKMI